MSDKYLPIQFFEKRKDFDDRLTEGGGDNHIPSWVLVGDELSLRSGALVYSVNSLSIGFKDRKAKGYKLPMVVKTTIEEKAIAKSHRNNITSLYTNKLGENNVLGFFGDRSLLTMIDDDSIIARIEQIVSDTQRQAKTISSIVNIEQFSPQVDQYDDKNSLYKIRLINYNDYDLNNNVKISFEKQCENCGITILRKTKYTSEMTIYRVCPDNAAQFSKLKEFDGIYSIERMEPITLTLDSLLIDDKIPIKIPKEGEDYPCIGVLDTGVADNAYLKPWKDVSNFTNYPDDYKDMTHGTFVAGIIEYGDELNNSSYTQLSGVRLFDATVYPDTNKETIYQDELIDHIREAISKHNDIKIWNLSLGTVEESSLNEFSDFGMALDNIQDEFNVLIVKSAGNDINFMKQQPKSRIAKSADSVRSLVVGSIAHNKGYYDYAEINMPSPFTRVGPGPGNIIKPDLVFYGGNAGMHNGRLYTTGVPSFSVDGDIKTMPGTSFSTPNVTRLAAELMFCMKEEFDPLLIKALMIHNAKYPSGNGMKMADKIKQMGFGMPDSIDNMLYNSSSEITLILRDTLDKGSFIEMFDFPFPNSLVDDNGYFIGQIIVTLVTKSLLDDKQAGEYCQSNMDILFGTYENEKNRDISKPTVKNPKGLSEPVNVLLDSHYSSSVKNVYPKAQFERECVLVKYGKKYHPIKKYAVDLSDMTPSNRKRFLNKERKWYLKLEGLYRDFIEKDSLYNNYQLSQEYCLLLTIRDPNGNIPVYDEVTQQLDIKNFVHHDIILRNTVNINLKSL